jgi:hypothetical protein
MNVGGARIERQLKVRSKGRFPVDLYVEKVSNQANQVNVDFIPTESHVIIFHVVIRTRGDSWLEFPNFFLFFYFWFKIEESFWLTLLKKPPFSY